MRSGIGNSNGGDGSVGRAVEQKDDRSEPADSLSRRGDRYTRVRDGSDPGASGVCGRKVVGCISEEARYRRRDGIAMRHIDVGSICGGSRQTEVQCHVQGVEADARAW